MRAKAAWQASEPFHRYNPGMRKEEFERGCAEMKARMLAQRAKPVPKPETKAPAARKASPAKRAARMPASGPVAEDEVAALRREVARLEVENRTLRQQIAVLASRSAASPTSTRSADDSVREQQHNYFKYSNARRY